MRVESKRLFLYPISDEAMRTLIDQEPDPEMKQAYTDMLEGCLAKPNNRMWSAVWNMELKSNPGIIVGDFSFKGLGNDGVIEIGYGLKEEYKQRRIEGKLDRNAGK
jgi:RimJ/RimL family protein N-acetyltransferase